MDPFAALGDPVRRQVIELLQQGPLPAGRIAGAFGHLSRPAVSRHLRVLREAGLVEADLVGRERRYRVRTEALDDVQAWLDRVRSPVPDTDTADDADVAADTWGRRFDALATEVHRTRRQRARDGHAAVPRPDHPADPAHPEQEQTA